MADKLIPGLPESLKIAILQQKDDSEDVSTPEHEAATSRPDEPGNASEGGEKKTVLQTVLQSDIARNGIVRKIKSMHLGQ